MKVSRLRRSARRLKEAVRWAGTGGFTRHSRIHYGAGAYPLSDYLPDSRLMALDTINGDLSNRVLKDKLLFRYFMSAHFNIPEIVAFIEKGTVYAPPGGGRVGDLAALRAFCEGSLGVVLKRADGRAGIGVVSLKVEGGDWLLSGRRAAPGEVETLVSRLDNYLVTALVPQAAYAAAVFPHSANSVRIVTMQDPDRGGEPFIAVAYQKFGSLASVPTDNWSAGGLRAEIDLETGELKPALKKYLKRRRQHVFYEQHPETGGQIAGVVIPGWRELKARLLTVLGELRFFKLVGWDVLLQDSGFCVLEGNTRPSLISLQATRPILYDPRARRFLEAHGIVEGRP